MNARGAAIAANGQPCNVLYKNNGCFQPPPSLSESAAELLKEWLKTLKRALQVAMPFQGVKRGCLELVDLQALGPFS